MHWLHPAREIGRRWWCLPLLALLLITVAGVAGVLKP
jgi:hypothetical protein